VVTTSLLLLMLLLPGVARAQTVIQKDALRQQLEGDLMCTCGGCLAPMNNCPMAGACHGLKEQREKVNRMIDQGMTREQIKAALVREHGGGDVLSAPPGEAVNRLAWALPYVAGATGAALVGLVAYRWTRRPAMADGSAAAGAEGPGEDALAARLGDELRDLDERRLSRQPLFRAAVSDGSNGRRRHGAAGRSGTSHPDQPDGRRRGARGAVLITAA